MKMREIIKRIDEVAMESVFETTQEVQGARLYPVSSGHFGVKTPDGVKVVANSSLSVEISQTSRCYIVGGMVRTIDGKKYRVNGNNLEDINAPRKEPEYTPEPPPSPPQKNPHTGPGLSPEKMAQRIAANKSIGDDGIVHGRKMGWIK